MSWRHRILWGSIFAFYVLLFLYAIPAAPKVCEQAAGSNEQHCTPHRIPAFLFIEATKTFNDYGAAITALATIAIAAFTWTLKQSTDKLWEASHDELAVAKDSAVAAKRSALVAEAALLSLERPYLFLRPKFNCSHQRPALPDGSFGFGFKMEFGFTNFGRSPGIAGITKASLFLDQFPPRIDENRMFVRLGSRIVAQGAAADWPPCLLGPMTAEDYARWSDGSVTLFFIGELAYADVLGNEYVCGFGIRQTERSPTDFTTDGLAKYNYQRKTKDAFRAPSA
jgi:hypothetical protein